MTLARTVVTLMAVGVVGVAVLAVEVVILAGVEAKLVWVNENGPPVPPIVFFCIATTGIL